MYLFYFSTCFEQPNAHHQVNKLYQYIICYVSLCVGDCLVCRSLLTQINTLKKCVKLVINKNYTEMHGQQNMKFFVKILDEISDIVNR